MAIVESPETLDAYEILQGTKKNASTLDTAGIQTHDLGDTPCHKLCH